MDKYGFIDADTYSFECDFNEERVTDRCARGNDVAGWVDLFPVNERGEITSVEPERHHGSVVFSKVEGHNRAGRVAAIALTEISEYKYQVRRLEDTITGLEQQMVALVRDVSMLRADLPQEPALEL